MCKGKVVKFKGHEQLWLVRALECRSARSLLLLMILIRSRLWLLLLLLACDWTVARRNDDMTLQWNKSTWARARARGYAGNIAPYTRR